MPLEPDQYFLGHPWRRKAFKRVDAFNGEALNARRYSLARSPIVLYDRPYAPVALDLHGFRRDAAERTVRSFLLLADECRLPVVNVICGKDSLVMRPLLESIAFRGSEGGDLVEWAADRGAFFSIIMRAGDRSLWSDVRYCALDEIDEMAEAGGQRALVARDRTPVGDAEEEDARDEEEGDEDPGASDHPYGVPLGEVRSGATEQRALESDPVTPEELFPKRDRCMKNLEKEVKRIQVYVWARHIDGSDHYDHSIDEDEAIRALDAHYSAVGNRNNQDQVYLGILLFERAFEHPEQKAELFERARKIFEFYHRVTQETDWQAVEDRLDDIRRFQEGSSISAAGAAPESRARDMAPCESVRSGAVEVTESSAEAWEALRRAAVWEGRCDGVPSLLIHNKDEGHWGLVRPVAGSRDVLFLKLDTKYAILQLHQLSEPRVPLDVLAVIMTTAERDLPIMMDHEPPYDEALADIREFESMLLTGTGTGASSSGPPSRRAADADGRQSLKGAMATREQFAAHWIFLHALGWTSRYGPPVDAESRYIAAARALVDGALINLGQGLRAEDLPSGDDDVRIAVMRLVMRLVENVVRRFGLDRASVQEALRQCPELALALRSEITSPPAMEIATYLLEDPQVRRLGNLTESASPPNVGQAAVGGATEDVRRCRGPREAESEAEYLMEFFEAAAIPDVPKAPPHAPGASARKLDHRGARSIRGGNSFVEAVDAAVHQIEGLTDAEVVAGVLARDAHGVAGFERLYGGAWGETSACDTVCAQSLLVEFDEPMPLDGGKLTPLFVRGAAYAIAEAGIAHAFEIAVARSVHISVETIRNASRDSGEIARWIQHHLASDCLPEALQRIVSAQMRNDPEWTGTACSLLRQSVLAWRIDQAARAGRGPPTLTQLGTDRDVARTFVLLYLGAFIHLIRHVSLPLEARQRPTERPVPGSRRIAHEDCPPEARAGGLQAELNWYRERNRQQEGQRPFAIARGEQGGPRGRSGAGGCSALVAVLLVLVALAWIV